MAVNFLKKSKTETEKAAEDAKVREVVEATLTEIENNGDQAVRCLLYTSPSPRDTDKSRMPSSA